LSGGRVKSGRAFSLKSYQAFDRLLGADECTKSLCLSLSRLFLQQQRAATAFYSAAVTQAKAAGVIFQTIIKRGPSLSLSCSFFFCAKEQAGISTIERASRLASISYGRALFYDVSQRGDM